MRQRQFRRTGAVLICIMVILMLVGMMTLQAVQTLTLVRRSDSQRQQLRQARELVELGRIVAAEQSQTARSTDAAQIIKVQVTDEYVGEITFERVASNQRTRNRETSNPSSRQESEPMEGIPKSFGDLSRIKAVFPTNSQNSVTATWKPKTNLLFIPKEIE